MKSEDRTRAITLRQQGIAYSIDLHETADVLAARTHWFNQLGYEAIQTAPITWKRHQPRICRTNVGPTYHGLLRIAVAKSTALNRRIAGWVEGLWAAIGE